MTEQKVICGDNIEVLKTLADNSIDACVTDPPYGLSGKHFGDIIFDIFKRSFNIILPNFNQFNFERIKYSDLVTISVKGSDLGRVEVLNVIKPLVCMPESTIDLNGNISGWYEKINGGGKPSGDIITKRMLMDKVNTNSAKYIGNYILDFGDSLDLSGSNVLRGNVGEFSLSSFSMPISSILTSLNPNSLTHSDPVFMGNGVDDIVGFGNESLSETLPTSFVLASGGAENGLVLRVETRGGADEFFATISTTINSDTGGQFLRPKIVRTFATTSSLSSKLQPCTVCLICNSADGTDALYYFHLFLPKDLFTNLIKSFDNAGGFMSHRWDYDVPTIELWREVFRVLKPGGYLLSFGGTRTYHRLVVNIEDAGFEIRDQMQWLYGCLSDDTEILTKEGWIRYDNFKKSNKISILCYDLSLDAYFWETPSKWNEYTIKDTCYRIQSDFTDQLVSRNHRCIVEREGNLLFEFAETLAREQQASVPFLEILPSMQRNISNVQQRAGDKKQMLFEKLRKQVDRFGKFRENANGRKEDEVDLLRSMWNWLLQTFVSFKSSIYTYLQSAMQWRFAWTRMEGACAQGEGGMDRRGRIELQIKNVRSKQPVLEGWCNIQEQERVLCGSEIEICEVPGSIYGNGEKGWLRNGVPINNGETNREMLDKGGVCSSHRPQSDEQRYNEFDVIQEQSRAQTIRSRKSYNTTLATITTVEYNGVIFCPTVSTGAFVARRNGKIFITGNSGFPKSHDISKAIDKAAGAERKVVGKYVPPNGKEWNLKQSENSDIEHAAGTFTASGTRKLDITEAATDDARSAVGLGTALKPSHEPIVLARKPLEKGLTVAENFIKYGTGGMNIDGCRIVTDETITNHSRSAESAVSKGKYGDSEEQETHQTEGQRLGRFPSNVILSHHAECVYVGTKQVKGSNCKPSDIGKGREGKDFTNGIYGAQESKVTVSHTDEDGNETVESWECHQDCPVRILDEQSGILKSGAMKKPYTYKNTGFSLGAPAGATKQIHESSEGGASRFFYCAKASKSEREKGLEKFEAKSVAQEYGLKTSIDDREGRTQGERTNTPRANNHPTVKPVSLLRYLVRLITHPNGTCLDPFNGSGTTGISCKLEGFNYIGIEIDPAYCKISEARIAAWEPEKEEQPVPDNQLKMFE